MGLGSSSSLWIMAVTNTAVLPIPLLAWHKMSPPFKALGIASYYTSLGCSNPAS
jgi:hypothetical protein